jgi:hypothetical protein
MKKQLLLSAIVLTIGAILFAQEKTEVSMKVVKDGKVVKDTTYTFDDAKEAKHAVHMFDAMASDELDIHFSDSHDHMEIIHKDGKAMKHGQKAVFISEDGKKVKKTVDCNFEWISSDDGEEEVIIMKMDKDSHGHMYVSSDDEGGNVKVIVKEIDGGDCEDGKKKVMTKEIIVINGEEGDEGTWTVKEGEDGEDVMWKKIEGKDGEVIIIKKTKGDGDEEEIKVEIITKKVKDKDMKKVKAMKKEDIEKKEKKKSKK